MHYFPVNPSLPSDRFRISSVICVLRPIPRLCTGGLVDRYAESPQVRPPAKPTQGSRQMERGSTSRVAVFRRQSPPFRFGGRYSWLERK